MTLNLNPVCAANATIPLNSQGGFRRLFTCRCVQPGAKADAGFRIEATCSSLSGSVWFQELRSLGSRLNSTTKLLSDCRGHLCSHLCSLGPVGLPVFERTRGSHDMKSLPASTPERRFFFSGWFSAQELVSLSGNLPPSPAQPLFSLIVVSLRAKPPLQPAARVPSVPFLSPWRARIFL